MTSTATCLESLRDCPDSVDTQTHISWFVEQALQKEEWQSEGAAGIYCRCRALPLVIQNAPRFDRIAPHLQRILSQLDRGNRFAIGEADAVDDPTGTKWYPPNAFHTFWTLEALDLSRRFGADFERFAERHASPTRLNAMMLWAWQVLGTQLSLHSAKSSGLDTDQLLWALTIVTRFPDRGLFSPATLHYRDLVKQSVDTFFAAQDDTGTWVHHGPLFHYPKAGNAYCYIFESLVPLLKNALRPEATLLRTLLRPHVDRLFALLGYAEATRLLLTSGRAFGWSSGHRTNVPFAESWATAAVFSCMQALRRLVGIWTKEDALRDLNHRTLTEEPQAALKELADRGRTWFEPETVGEQLVTLFVNPILMKSTVTAVDPDDRPITERQARSAILFGPPGTSKTTLARAVAAAVEWEYVELHPSHFVAAGLPNVQRTADEIFTKLMELDRCVVLFDEIDELMRERLREPDAFGRFLTTSMLPKLAELWKQRRVLYFVATNHISHFDRALTRSQRFDALIFVAPPAFDVKEKKLLEILTELAPDISVQVQVTPAEIWKELEAVPPKVDRSVKELAHDQLLAKFVLLRWDQLEELAHILIRQTRQGRSAGSLVIDAAALRAALKEIGDSRLKEQGPYIEFLAERTRAGRDFGRDVVWLVEDGVDVPPAFERHVRNVDGRRWCRGTRELLSTAVGSATIEFLPVGRIRFTST